MGAVEHLQQVAAPERGGELLQRHFAIAVAAAKGVSQRIDGRGVVALAVALKGGLDRTEVAVRDVAWRDLQAGKQVATDEHGEMVRRVRKEVRASRR